MTTNLHELLEDALSSLREGRDAENWRHTLMEADGAIVPILVQAFRRETNPTVRWTLVHCVWQHRDADVVGFLEEALSVESPAIWKEALDGLVTHAGEKSVACLRRCLEDCPGEKSEWIREAIEQVEEQLSRSPG